MNLDEILNHYSKAIVKKEILDYCKNRWVAIHTVKGGETGLFIRYWRKPEKPLSFSSIDDFDRALREFRGLWPRTFYASVNIFKSLVDKEDLEKPDNIVLTTSIWDIDGSLEFWEKIVEAAKVIVDVLEKEGVANSVYLLWSGRGIHVHLHEKAISQEVLEKYHPLDIAYSIVEYVLAKSKERLLEIAKDTVSYDRPLKVENEIDLKRVFTVPLSLHKSVDYVAVCFKPDEIDDFHLDWAKPDSFKHNPDWRKHVEGEADQLALKAMQKVGGYFRRVGEKRTVVSAAKNSRAKPVTPKEVIERIPMGKIGRFQVMALLQAARYYLLTGDIKKAKSFGLNRAIFYAWAKYHGRRVIPKKGSRYKQEEELEEGKESGKKPVYVGNERVFISDDGWFIIGDKEQRPEDFDKEIVAKIESVVPFKKVWNAALEYLRKFPKSVLMDQQRFFKEVYDKVKDDFIEKVVKGKKRDKTLLDFLQ